MGTRGPKSGDSAHLQRGRETSVTKMRERLNDFAEAIADIGEVKATGKALGISQAAATRYMSLLRAKFGWQAQ